MSATHEQDPAINERRLRPIYGKDFKQNTQNHVGNEKLIV